MVFLGGALIGTTLLFLVLQVWIGVIIFGAITIGALATGAIGSPGQIRAARHPEQVTAVETTAWQSRNRPWVTLGEDSPHAPAVELRNRGQAKRMAQGHFPAKVAGRLEPGHWVVLQVGQVTIWPAGKVQRGLTEGAFHVNPDDINLRTRLRIRGPGGPPPGPQRF